MRERHPDEEQPPQSVELGLTFETRKYHAADGPGIMRRFVVRRAQNNRVADRFQDRYPSPVYG